MARSQEILAALTNAQAGGFLARPPGLDGDPGLGIAGVTGVPRGATWDAVASADCPDLPGDALTFTVLDDGTIVTDQELPDGSLGPLADELEATVSPPYRAAAIRSEGTLWTGVAQSVRILALPGFEGDMVELSVVGGQRELRIDGGPATGSVAALDELAQEQGDIALSAERIDGELFAVDLFPL